MSTFCAVNTSLSLAQPPVKSDEEHIPSTPRTAIFVSDSADAEELSEDAVKTPTRDSFSGVVGQKPLPEVISESPESRTDSKMDIVEEDDGSLSPQDTPTANDISQSKDGKDGSGGESVEGDSKLNKKKKSQRFFCTDYPPCKLSFTRSEHLARHIRYV
jgi:C2H2 transcription facotor